VVRKIAGKTAAIAAIVGLAQAESSTAVATAPAASRPRPTSAAAGTDWAAAVGRPTPAETVQPPAAIRVFMAIAAARSPMGWPAA